MLGRARRYTVKCFSIREIFGTILHQTTLDYSLPCCVLSRDNTSTSSIHRDCGGTYEVWPSKEKEHTKSKITPKSNRSLKHCYDFPIHEKHIVLNLNLPLCNIWFFATIHCDAILTITPQCTMLISAAEVSRQTKNIPMEEESLLKSNHKVQISRHSLQSKLCRQNKTRTHKHPICNAIIFYCLMKGN